MSESSRLVPLRSLGAPSVDQRLHRFCPSAQDVPLEELVKICDGCGAYILWCCHHPEKFCHHQRLVFIDGACTRNGAEDAIAGIGLVFGEYDGVDPEVQDTRNYRFSIDVGDVEPRLFDPKTSQRAELLAAFEAVRRILLGGWLVDTRALWAERDRYGYRTQEAREIWILASDSQYLVRGITEWVPEWKANDWRTKQGRAPANVDLFKRLDQYLSMAGDLGLGIRFWWIPRELSRAADSLAKQAAVDAAKLGASHEDYCEARMRGITVRELCGL